LKKDQKTEQEKDSIESEGVMGLSIEYIMMKGQWNGFM
jgi:hypothetical protein